MIQITPHMKILLAVQPVDFRLGIDGLARKCRVIIEEDPFSGCLFVFRNRKGTSLKLLQYDSQGFWLFYKRLSKGKFHWWPQSGEGSVIPLNVQKLHLLIWNGNPEKAQCMPPWREIPKAE